MESRFVGMIIGKKGAQVKQISQESGCRIKVDKKKGNSSPVCNIFLEGHP